MHDERVVTVSRFTCETCGFLALSKGGLSYHITNSHLKEREFKRLRGFLKLVEACYQKVPLIVISRIRIRLGMNHFVF